MKILFFKSIEFQPNIKTKPLQKYNNIILYKNKKTHVIKDLQTQLVISQHFTLLRLIFLKKTTKSSTILHI